MKDIRCILGRHKFSEWIEVGNHLERECLRCGVVDAKYPDPLTSIAKIVAGLIWKFYEFDTSARKIVYNNRYRDDDK